MAKNPNENGTYDVIHASGWSQGNKIEQKTRLVVIRYRNTRKPMRYAVRWQSGRGDDGPTFGGSSFGSEGTAHAAFIDQYYKHNSVYRNGNPSHLPKIVK